MDIVGGVESTCDCIIHSRHQSITTSLYEVFCLKCIFSSHVDL